LTLALEFVHVYFDFCFKISKNKKEKKVQKEKFEKKIIESQEWQAFL